MVDLGGSAELGPQHAVGQRPGSQRASAIVVAGMHRTGTSAVTRVLGLLGIDLPRHLVPGVAANNDLGFWESVPISEAHDRFLASIGSAWDDVSPIPPSVFASARADAFVDELSELLLAEYGDSSLFVVKDPRLCRLIPIWVAALDRFGARPSFVITTRNPLEVAGSLRARDGFSGTKSCLLWLRHLLDAERGSRGFPRVFVSYERLLRDWLGTSEHIARELHLFWPHSGHEAHHQIEEYLSSELRHHSFDSADVQARSDVTAWVKQAFEEVSRATTDADDVDSDFFDEIRAQLDRADHAYGPLLAQARASISQLDEARVEAESQAAALANALAERQDALDSLDVDNRLVTERLVEEIETVARLQRLLDELPEVAGRFGRGLGDAGAALLAADDETVTLQTAVQEVLDELRHRTTLADEPEVVRQAIDETIRQTEGFLRSLDEDRARLLAELAERDAREAQGREGREAFENELAARAEVLRATREKSEEQLAQSAAEYQTLRAEAQQLAAALADNETILADARLERESALAHAAQAAAALGELEAALADAASRESALGQTLGEREGELAAALERAEAAEFRLRSAAAERDAIRTEREEWLAKSARLQMAVAEQEQTIEEVRAENAQLNQSLSAQEERLAKTLAEAGRLPAALDRAEAAESHLRSTSAELDKLTQDLGAQEERLEEALAEAGRLPAALDRAEAAESQLHSTTAELDKALADSAKLSRDLDTQEERLAQTLAEAGQLAAALADTEDALSRRTAELVERDERLDVREAEVAARDELLAQGAAEHARLAAELQVRDETLATQSELLERLDVIGRERSRRWRSLSQFCSWLVPPTAEHRGYIKAYLQLRNTDQFDRDYYLSRNPDVAHLGLNPLMHYVEHGRREGRQPKGTRTELPFVMSQHQTPQLPPAKALPPPPRVETPQEPVAALEGEAHVANPLSELAAHVPETAVIAVATGGDESLLSSARRRTFHFPRASDGSYGGNNASGDTALIANLEATRAAGAEFLFVPPSRRELLEGNPRFRTHLLGLYARVFDSEQAGLCLALDAPDSNSSWRRQLSDLAEWIERETNREASILDWDSGLQLAEELPACSVFTFSEPELPHLDGSVDIVATATSSADRLAEASRVARQAVLEVAPDAAPRLTASASFAEHAPSVSIVVPCHEEFRHTQACMHALAETLPTWFRGEILIVDDASSPETVEELQRLADSTPNVRLLRNDVNSGFIASVNRAVEEAAGEFVVLLNNDTIPLPGWLPPLLAPFRTRDDVGAVGGRLVYPDGRLQEAGGIVFRDGSAAKFGYGDREPDFPLFTVPREVDYCSGCLLTFRRDFFLESGGFDPEYGFGFYEDTDFCFRVRALGRVVLYEPESVIVHVEGASAGTDLTQGAKRFQAVNASLFTERWQTALAHQHERPAELDREALHQLARRRETR